MRAIDYLVAFIVATVIAVLAIFASYTISETTEFSFTMVLAIIWGIVVLIAVSILAIYDRSNK